MSAFNSSINSLWQTTQRSSRVIARARASERGVGQHLVGLDGAGRERREAEDEGEERAARIGAHSAGTAADGAARRAGAPTR